MSDTARTHTESHRLPRAEAGDRVRKALTNGGRKIPLARASMRLVRPVDRVMVLGPGDGSVAALLAGRRGVPNLCAVEPDQAPRAALRRAFLEQGLFRTRLESKVPTDWSTTCLIADLTICMPDEAELDQCMPSRVALIQDLAEGAENSDFVCRLLDDGMHLLPGAWGPGILALARQ